MTKKDRLYAEKQMMKHRPCFTRILSSCGISNKEYTYRIKELEEAELLPGSRLSMISARYYQLVHEIKAIQFLQRLGDLQIADDAHSKAGVDFILNKVCYIEAVCASSGNDRNLEKMGIKQTLGDGKLYDYSEKERLLFCRLTSSLDSKLKFYDKHVEGGTIPTDIPYIVFLGLGDLSLDMFAGENGIELASILLANGNPQITLLGDTQIKDASGFAFVPQILKSNGAPVATDLFYTKEYQVISGVLFSDADLFEEYTADNTWLFTNPNAINKLDVQEFNGCTYWAVDEDEMYRAH